MIIAERVFEVVTYTGPPNSILVNWNIFQILVMFGAFSFIAFFFMFLGLITNRESWFWFTMRFSNQIAVAEFDDSGGVVFKKVKSVGQGVVLGHDDKFDYAVTPRNIAIDIEPFIKEESNRRTENYITQLKAQEPEKVLEPEAIEAIYQKIRVQVQEEFSSIEGALNVSTRINSFRAFTKGTRSPFFVRYSGKAVIVNPLTAVVISGGEYARVQDLKTFIGKMITPSQIKFIASLSEMIGAKQLKREGGISPILLIGGIFVLLLVFVFVILPYFGINVMNFGAG